MTEATKQQQEKLSTTTADVYELGLESWTVKKAESRRIDAFEPAPAPTCHSAKERASHQLPYPVAMPFLPGGTLSSKQPG